MFTAWHYSLWAVFSNALNGCKCNKLLEPVKMKSWTEFCSVHVKMATLSEQTAVDVICSRLFLWYMYLL